MHWPLAPQRTTSFAARTVASCTCRPPPALPCPLSLLTYVPRAAPCTPLSLLCLSHASPISPPPVLRYACTMPTPIVGLCSVTKSARHHGALPPCSPLLSPPCGHAPVLVPCMTTKLAVAHNPTEPPADQTSYELVFSSRSCSHSPSHLRTTTNTEKQSRWVRSTLRCPARYWCGVAQTRQVHVRTVQY